MGLSKLSQQWPNDWAIIWSLSTLWDKLLSTSTSTTSSLFYVEAADAKAPHPHRGKVPPFKAEIPNIKLTSSETRLLEEGKPVFKQEPVSTNGMYSLYIYIYLIWIYLSYI